MINHSSKKTGFTLIEIMVVVGIIGLLSAVAAVSFARQRANSRNARRVSDLKSMQTALDLYANDNTNKYPSSGGNYSADFGSYRTNRPGGSSAADGGYVTGLVPTYVRALPIDPLYPPSDTGTRGYLYISNSTDYAFIAYGTAEGMWDTTYPFYDAVANRQAGSDNPSWKIYSAGGVNW